MGRKSPLHFDAWKELPQVNSRHLIFVRYPFLRKMVSTASGDSTAVICPMKSSAGLLRFLTFWAIKAIWKTFQIRTPPSPRPSASPPVACSGISPQLEKMQISELPRFCQDLFTDDQICGNGIEGVGGGSSGHCATHARHGTYLTVRATNTRHSRPVTHGKLFSAVPRD